MAQLRCPNDDMLIPLVAQILDQPELLRYYWCWSCEELYAYAGEPSRLVAGFAWNARCDIWKVFQVYGGTQDVQLARANVSKVAPQV